MRNCRICGKHTKVNKSKICAKCLDIKYFRCHCCDKVFSYNELIARNLQTSSMYKCFNPRKEKISCRTCKKSKFLLMNYNQLCLDCTHKENALEKLGTKKLLLMKEHIKYTEHMEVVEKICEKIRGEFTELQKIEDPIASRDQIHGYDGLLRQIYNIYDVLNKEETRVIKQEISIRRLETIIADLKKEVFKQQKAFACYDIAKTFLLCGSRPEIAQNIQKPIQKIIAKYILQEFFLVSF